MEENKEITEITEQPEQTEVETAMEMDESFLEQPLEVENEGSKILGKFASVQELSDAYESLQAEFTRKSQMLARLDKKPANRDDIIKEYLTSVALRPVAPVVITGSGDFALGTKPEPKTLRDIESVAENYFKTKGEN